MDARRLDAAEARDGARELALEGTLVVQALEEVRLPERLAVEELETDAAAPGEAAAREREAELVEPLGGHQDGAAAVLEPEGRLLGAQRLDDRARVLLGQVREQRPIERPLHPPREPEHDDERAHAGRGEDDPPRRRLRVDEVDELDPELLESRPHLASSARPTRRASSSSVARSAASAAAARAGSPRARAMRTSPAAASMRSGGVAPAASARA